MHRFFIGRRKYGSTVRIVLEMFLPSRNMNLYYDSNVRILLHKYYLFAFAFSTSRRLSSFNTATASLIVRGRLSYARRWLNRSATEIILLSAALPVLRTAAESGEGSPERRDEGTARRLDHHDDAERTTPTFSPARTNGDADAQGTPSTMDTTMDTSSASSFSLAPGSKASVDFSDSRLKSALHSLRIFCCLFVSVRLHTQRQRGMSSSGCRKLFFPRGIANAGSSDRLMRGSVRFGSCATSVK